MRIVFIFSTLIIALGAGTSRAQTPRRATIDVELATESESSPTAMQQWFEILRDLKVDNLRARTAGFSDGPSVTAANNAGVTVYKVVGIVSRNGDLILPGGRYRTTERGRLGDWFSDLRRYGPAGNSAGGRGKFGLSKEEFDALRADLAHPVSFSTKEMAPADFVHRIADQSRHALTGDASSAKQLAAGAPIDSELRGVSLGTALAFVLDCQGLAVVPRLDKRGQAALAITAQRQNQEQWPVGWPSQKPRRDLVPALFDTADVELDKVELPRVLAAVGEHIAVPILVDAGGLAEEKVDPATIKVSLPAKRTMYEILLRKVLVPHKLAHEVRVDEAQRPFVWISTARKVSIVKSREAAK
ncbi:MAG TPA: hypothetical protein VHD36_19280 [Pirellulales bacterium]|nr:hypothetical protein [Pirellulales bacterium]